MLTLHIFVGLLLYFSIYITFTKSFHLYIPIQRLATCWRFSRIFALPYWKCHLNNLTNFLFLKLTFEISRLQYQISSWRNLLQYLKFFGMFKNRIIILLTYLLTYPLIYFLAILKLFNLNNCLPFQLFHVDERL